MCEKTCESKNHPSEHCSGDLWQCHRCLRWLCEMEGAADTWFWLCDDCWNVAEFASDRLELVIDWSTIGAAYHYVAVDPDYRVLAFSHRPVQNERHCWGVAPTPLWPPPREKVLANCIGRLPAGNGLAIWLYERPQIRN